MSKLPSRYHEDAELYPLAKPDGPTAPRGVDVRRMNPPPNIDALAAQQERIESRQLSLTWLLAVVALAGCGLALMRLLPPRMFAGVAGLMSLFTLAVVSWLSPRSLAMQVVLWTVFSLYVLGAVMALWQS